MFRGLPHYGDCSSRVTHYANSADMMEEIISGRLLGYKSTNRFLSGPSSIDSENKTIILIVVPDV